MQDVRAMLAAGLIGVGVLALAGCSSSSEAPPTPLSRVATITLTADSLQGDSIALVFGDTAQLTATALDAQGNPVTGVSFVWTSSDTTVATVSPSGLTTAVGFGNAEIDASAVAMATSGGLGGTAPLFASSSKRSRIQIIVYPHMKIMPTSATVDIGGAVTFTVSYVDASGKTRSDLGWPDPAPFWRSKDTSIATVDGVGVATGVKGGKTTITASATRYPLRYAGAPLSRSAALTVVACGGIAAVQSWIADIAVRYTPRDTVTPDSAKFHTLQVSDAHATLYLRPAVPDSLTQGIWSAAVSPTNPQTMLGSSTIHDFFSNKNGLQTSYDADTAHLQPGTVMELVVSRQSTGCQYRLEYIDAITYQLTSGGSPPLTQTGGIGDAVITDVALPTAVNGSWILTGSVDIPAELNTGLPPLASTYYPGIGAVSLLAAVGGTYKTAHVSYTLTSQKP